MNTDEAIHECRRMANGMEDGGYDENAHAIRALIRLVAPEVKVRIDGKIVKADSWDDLFSRRVTL